MERHGGDGRYRRRFLPNALSVAVRCGSVAHLLVGRGSLEVFSVHVQPANSATRKGHSLPANLPASLPSRSTHRGLPHFRSKASASLKTFVSQSWLSRISSRLPRASFCSCYMRWVWSLFLTANSKTLCAHLHQFPERVVDPLRLSLFRFFQHFISNGPERAE